MISQVKNNNRTEPALQLAYIAVAISFFISGAACASWLARIPPIQERLGIGAALLGTAFVFLSLGSVIGMKLSGRWAVELGSKKLIVWATALMCLTLPVPGFASNFIILSLSIFFFGICLGTVNILMNTLAVDLEHQLQRPIISTLHGLHSVGSMVGAIIGSFMSMAHVVPWIHFSIAGAVFATTIPLSQKWLVAIAEDKEKPAVAKTLGTFKAFLTPYLLALTLVAFGACWTEGIMADWSAVYFRSVLHSTYEAAPNGFVAFSITMSLGRLTGDWLLKRLGAALLVRGGAVISLTGLVVALSSTTPELAIAGFSFIGLGLANIVPVVFRAAGNVPNTNTSESLATVASISYFSFMIGPPIAGFVAQYFGLRSALAIAIPLLIVIILLAQAAKLVPSQSSIESKTPVV